MRSKCSCHSNVSEGSTSCILISLTVNAALDPNAILIVHIFLASPLYVYPSLFVTTSFGRSAVHTVYTLKKSRISLPCFANDIISL